MFTQILTDDTVIAFYRYFENFFTYLKPIY